jgi:cation:H+ antiporter
VRAFRPVAVVAVVALPAVLVRLSGGHPAPVVSLLLFGAAVVASSFLLAWAAEAAQMDISGGLAIAVLALIAVLPEYAVDLYFAFAAGHDPTYTAYAAANMTGSNRLLMGLGWPVVVILGLMVARREGNPVTALVLEPGTRVELGFLLVAGIVAFAAPASGTISLPLGVALLAWFAFYLYRMAREDVDEPMLVGTAATLAALAPRTRRATVVAMFAAAAIVVLLSAQPFAESLVATGKQAGIDEFLLVQWLAPLATEAPEFIVAILFTVRGNAQDAIGTLISSKVNQWTLLVGSLPLAYLVGGGGAGGLPLDARQVEEMVLTGAQTLMGVSILLALRFPRWGAWSLLGLFAVQFVVPGTSGRVVLSVVYLAVAAVAFVVHRRLVVPTLRAPFRERD